MATGYLAPSPCFRNARAFPLLPAALASVPFGFVLVRVRVPCAALRRALDGRSWASLLVAGIIASSSLLPSPAAGTGSTGTGTGQNEHKAENWLHQGYDSSFRGIPARGLKNSLYVAFPRVFRGLSAGYPFSAP